MEQRSLRLGDIVDDYCPRERRVTNHAIVALVGNTIRQTRCSTCDAEHEYKEAKVPKKRTKAGSELAGGVLVTPKAANGAPEPPKIDVEAEIPEPVAPVALKLDKSQPEPEPEQAPQAATQGAPENNGHAEPAAGGQPEGWFSHRPLIRASLPK